MFCSFQLTVKFIFITASLKYEEPIPFFQLAFKIGENPSVGNILKQPTYPLS